VPWAWADKVPPLIRQIRLQASGTWIQRPTKKNRVNSPEAF
jgi:hypothetical protein